jgi:hypothetical protein
VSHLLARRGSGQRRAGTSRRATQEGRTTARDVVGRQQRRRRTLARPSRHSEDLRTRCGDDWGEEASPGDCNTDVPCPTLTTGQIDVDVAPLWSALIEPQRDERTAAIVGRPRERRKNNVVLEQLLGLRSK